jgi:hypothetical protein
MQTKVIYLKGDASDAERLNAVEGFKLQSVVSSQGQIVGYMVREPWAPQALDKPLETRSDDLRGNPIRNQGGKRR